MSSSVENGVLWDHLFDRRGLKVDARWGVLHNKVRIYRITHKELKELLGRREAPQALIQALECRKKVVPLRNLPLSKVEALSVAQAIVKDMTGSTIDLVGGARELISIIKKMEPTEKAEKTEKAEPEKTPHQEEESKGE
jgi:hypothetical protein